MKPNTMYLLQAIGFFLQTVNAGLSGTIHDPTVSVLIAAGVGAYQFYCQHMGIVSPSPSQIQANQTPIVVPPKPEEIK
jgi:hypothetical protein